MNPRVRRTQQLVVDTQVSGSLWSTNCSQTATVDEDEDLSEPLVYDVEYIKNFDSTTSFNLSLWETLGPNLNFRWTTRK